MNAREAAPLFLMAPRGPPSRNLRVPLCWTEAARHGLLRTALPAPRLRLLASAAGAPRAVVVRRAVSSEQR